jgi:hypothetical protein
MLEKDLRESQSPLPPPLPARTASRPTVLETSAAEGSWQSQWAGPGAGGRPRCDIDSAAAELGGDATPTSERSNSRPSSGGQLSSPAAASAAATAGVSNPVRRPSCPLQSPRIVNGTPLTGLSKSPSTRETSSNRPMVVLAAPRKYSLPCDMLDRPPAAAAGCSRCLSSSLLSAAAESCWYFGQIGRLIRSHWCRRQLPAAKTSKVGFAVSI